MKTFVH